MPLATITLMKGRSREEKRAIAEAVQRALVETIGIPQDDRFQIIHELDRDSIVYDPSYLGVARSDGIVIVQITLRGGRPREMRVAFHRRLAEILAETANVRPEDVFITLVENDYADWSVGNGEAPLMNLVES